MSNNSSPASRRSASPAGSPVAAARSRSSSASSRSRSRSVSSSSSSSPRFVSATDSEAEKKPSSPKRKANRTKKSPKHRQDDHSDSEAEDEPSAVASKKKVASPTKRPVRGAALRRSKKKAESEEGELVSDGSNKEEFDDGLDEDLIGDDADRSKLEVMTEREREEELFKRAENREQLKKRFEIQKKLKSQQKLKAKDSLDEDDEDYNNVLDTKERSQNRQKKIEEKKFDQKSSALSELKAKRQEKERKDIERQKKESNRDEDDHKSRTSRRQRSSSSSSSGGSERSRRSSTSSRSSSGSGSDTERFKKSPSKVQKYIETQEDLEPIRLSRYKLERFAHLPFFKKLVMNCFVRIGIGQANGKSVYRAAEIVDVVETTKVYSVGSVRTNTGLKLKFGKQERVFRLEFISNQHILIQEFAKWKEACVESSMSVPTLDFVKVKGSEIKKALSYEYTSDDVDKIVAQKGRFLRHPVNYAMHKARLMKEKEIAIANGDDALARELETKLNDHEERAEELDKQRTSTISSVSLINDRNRKANVSKAESAIRHEMKVKLTEGVQSNPFTRRKCNPRIVTKKVDKTGLDIRMEKEKENLIKIAETTITLKRNAGEAVEGGGEVAKDGAEPAKKAKKTKLGMGMPMAMQKEDLFDAHNFDIEIDVGDTSLTSPGAPGGPTGPSSAIALKAVSLTTTSTTKKSFNLGDYKKKMGLM